jgi:predicted nucleic acid-binding protein
VTTGGANGYGVFVELSAAEIAFARQLSTALGAGERKCLAAAARRQGMLASDDADARRAARRFRVPVTGTIGILVLAVRKSHLDLAEASSLLSGIFDLGYRSPVAKLDGLI